MVVPQWDHPGGIVLPHYEVAIVDENDDLLAPGEDGEMVIRPSEPGVMADGYFGMPEKTLETRRNLWFHTGDIGSLDEDGLFIFAGAWTSESAFSARWCQVSRSRRERCAVRE